MDEFVKGVFTAPVATLLIVFGMPFLLIAVVGNISGKIEPGVKGRIASGVLGGALLFIGLAMHFTQDVSKSFPIPSEHAELNKATMPPEKATNGEASATRESIEAMPNTSGQEAKMSSGSVGSARSVADNEPNDHIAAAQLITEGTAIRGSLATNQDRDFYKFNAPGSGTRVILRKLSVPGFNGTVDIYDAVENQIASGTTFGDQTISLFFESVAGAVYYIVVKSLHYKSRGDYELVMRKE